MLRHLRDNPHVDTGHNRRSDTETDLATAVSDEGDEMSYESRKFEASSKRIDRIISEVATPPGAPAPPPLAFQVETSKDLDAPGSSL